MTLTTSAATVLIGPSLPGAAGGTSYTVSAMVDVLAPNQDGTAQPP